MKNHDKLKNARNNKKDEFYTRIEDIEAELGKHKDYWEFFENATVYCNCDNPKQSNFCEFFLTHFDNLKLKKLVATYYAPEGPACKTEWIKYGREIKGTTILLCGNGKFQSKECQQILKEADIIVTNPPFSQFRLYVDILMNFDKKFVVLGTTNAISYTNFFKWIQEGRIYPGYGFNKTMTFEVGSGYKYDEKLSSSINDGKKYGKVPGISWYTNLNINKRYKRLQLTTKYSEKEYPAYHNYPAINVKSMADIPSDYDGVMGVPITFLGNYCPEQFEIVGLGYGESAKKIGMNPIGEDFLKRYFEQGNKGNYVANNVLCCYTDNDGRVKIPYARVLIRKKSLL